MVAEDGVGAAAGGEVDAVLAVRPRSRPVPLVPHEVRHVLVQPSTGGHHHDLHAPADAQRRKVAVGGDLGERQLAVIPVRAKARGVLLHRGAVPLGVDVGAAREDQAVQQREDLDRIGGARGDQHRESAGGLERADVRIGHQHRVHVPRAPAGRARDRP